MEHLLFADKEGRSYAKKAKQPNKKMLHTVWNLPSYHTGILLLSVLLLKGFYLSDSRQSWKICISKFLPPCKTGGTFLQLFVRACNYYCRKMERSRVSLAAKWSNKQDGSEKSRGCDSPQDDSRVNCASCPVAHQSQGSARYRSDSSSSGQRPATVTLPTHTLRGSQPSPHVTHTVHGLPHRINKAEKPSEIMGSNLWPDIPVSARPRPWVPCPVFP